MGLETTCKIHLGRTAFEGRAHVDSLQFTFRGGTRLDLPLQTIRSALVDRNGALHVTHAAGEFSLLLGDAIIAAKWSNKLMHPPTRLDKLGLKPGQRVVALGIDDDSFADEAAARLGTAPTAQLTRDLDVIFYSADSIAALAKLASLKKHLRPAGAIWVVSRKGKTATIRDVDVIAAARTAGLVDNKVCSFSDTHTALRLVIPRAQR